MNKIANIIAVPVLAGTLAACGAADRVATIGKAPDLTAIKNPATKTGYRPVQMPMPTATPAHYNPNSLWRTGRRSFFKDQRARKVGDILTVKVVVDDEGKIDNSTKRSRGGTEGAGLTGGLGAVLKKHLPTGVAADKLVEATGSGKHEGAGSISRKEELTTTVAAVIMQVLPNGNMVIEGRQEIRVNFELRELIVAGVIRPEDIAADNTIESTKIAEARISYGGRGQITDMQQPRYGQQLLDILLPI